MSELSQGDCGVCIGGYGDDDPATLSLSDIVKARKPHKCEECGGQILAGQKYERNKWLYDGEWSRMDICLLCAEIGAAFSCEGRLLGDMWQDIHDNMFPNMTTGCLAKLKTAAAKQFLLDKWNKWKFGGDRLGTNEGEVGQ
jgi:hypothetical protein